MGVGAAVLLSLAARDPIGSLAFWHLGATLSFVALALAPQTLFERISIERLKIHGPVFYGGAALASIAALACYTMAAMFWVAEGIH
jgi:hypothetical protein